MQPGHDGADRDVEDLCGVRVAELAEVDEHDHVAEVVRQVGERVDDASLREPLDDLLLLECLLALDRRQPVGEVVVAFLERRQVRRSLLPPAAVDVEVGEDAQQPRTQVRTRCVALPALASGYAYHDADAT